MIALGAPQNEQYNKFIQHLECLFIQQLRFEMKQLKDQCSVLNAENVTLKRQCNQIETHSRKSNPIFID